MWFVDCVLLGPWHKRHGQVAVPKAAIPSWSWQVSVSYERPNAYKSPHFHVESLSHYGIIFPSLIQVIDQIYNLTICILKTPKLGFISMTSRQDWEKRHFLWDVCYYFSFKLNRSVCLLDMMTLEIKLSSMCCSVPIVRITTEVD